MSSLRPRTIRLASAVTAVVLAVTVVQLGADSAAADTLPAPPFQQCPAIGQDTSCGLLIVVNPDGTTTVLGDPSQQPFDGMEDTLVGVQNNSTQTVYTIPISSSSSAGSIFGFDGDGICSGLYDQSPAGCPWGPSGYEGPGVSFSVTDADNGAINFPQGLSPTASTYFSLAAAVTAGEIVVPRYIALGDSYSSGEGVPPFIWPTDTSIDTCHRSYGAYPEQLDNPAVTSTSVEFWACSGAQIRNFYDSVAGELPQLQDLNGPQPTLVTLGVGGNDIGFARIVRTCTDVSVPFFGQQNPDYHPNCGTFLDQPGQLQPDNLINGLIWGNYNAQDNTYYSLGRLYADVNSRAPIAQVYVVGYPNPLPLPYAVTGDCQADVLTESGNTVGFGPYHVQFTVHYGDVNWMEKIEARLNSTIWLSATDAGFNFVDNSQTLAGHGVCGNQTDHWIHGVVVKSSAGTASAWSFHPEYRGQTAIAGAVSSAMAGPRYGDSGQQSAQQVVTVAPEQLRLAVEVDWSGKDVQPSLVSPSGVVYDRNSHRPDLIHRHQGHRELFTVKNPQAGVWAIKVNGQQHIRVKSTQIPRSDFAPVAAIKSSTDRGVAPAGIQFSSSGSSSYDGATITSDTWNFGDGSPAATGPSPTHVFAAPGVYKVTLAVTDSNGQTDRATQTVLITSSDQPPTATYIWGSLDPSTPEQMSFDASASTDVDGQITAYTWNFGDGATGSGILTAHRYATPGRHPVTLTVTDNGGQSSSFCQETDTGRFSGGALAPCTTA